MEVVFGWVSDAVRLAQCGFDIGHRAFDGCFGGSASQNGVKVVNTQKVLLGCRIGHKHKIVEVEQPLPFYRQHADDAKAPVFNLNPLPERFRSAKKLLLHPGADDDDMGSLSHIIAVDELSLLGLKIENARPHFSHANDTASKRLTLIRRGAAGDHFGRKVYERWHVRLTLECYDVTLF